MLHFKYDYYHMAAIAEQRYTPTQEIIDSAKNFRTQETAQLGHSILNSLAERSHTKYSKANTPEEKAKAKKENPAAGTLELYYRLTHAENVRQPEGNSAPVNQQDAITARDVNVFIHTNPDGTVYATSRRTKDDQKAFQIATVGGRNGNRIQCMVKVPSPTGGGFSNVAYELPIETVTDCVFLSSADVLLQDPSLTDNQKAALNLHGEVLQSGAIQNSDQADRIITEAAKESGRFTRDTAEKFARATLTNNKLVPAEQIDAKVAEIMNSIGEGNLLDEAGLKTLLNGVGLTPEGIQNQIEETKNEIPELEKKITELEQQLTALEGKPDDEEVKDEQGNDVQKKVSELRTEIHDKIKNAQADADFAQKQVKHLEDITKTLGAQEGTIQGFKKMVNGEIHLSPDDSRELMASIESGDNNKLLEASSKTLENMKKGADAKTIAEIEKWQDFIKNLANSKLAMVGGGLLLITLFMAFESIKSSGGGH